MYSVLIYANRKTLCKKENMRKKSEKNIYIYTIYQAKIIEFMG